MRDGDGFSVKDTPLPIERQKLPRFKGGEARRKACKNCFGKTGRVQGGASKLRLKRGGGCRELLRQGGAAHVEPNPDNGVVGCPVGAQGCLRQNTRHLFVRQVQVIDPFDADGHAVRFFNRLCHRDGGTGGQERKLLGGAGGTDNEGEIKADAPRGIKAAVKAAAACRLGICPDEGQVGRALPAECLCAQVGGVNGFVMLHPHATRQGGAEEVLGWPGGRGHGALLSCLCRAPSGSSLAKAVGIA